ncbi:hypothetical protein FGO68_gene17409 [Halteria grandinella]|uniref:NADAR domain-containing protein n=1 Tax=Halteria grandinella TaxID=5974 RepID=A0A8J8NIM1_HALGN|nr:hypothetical protein FGO68_gene17409 [Halteria grandinella]
MNKSSLKQILFYSDEGPLAYLTNYYPAKFTLHGKVWPTSEHYFQAQKFPTRPDFQERIRLEETPDGAKDLAFSTREGFRSDWGEVKNGYMKEGIMEKFLQNEDIRMQLLETGDAQLVEHTTEDSYWGDGGDLGTGTIGQNMLGKILMEVRDALREKSKL